MEAYFEVLPDLWEHRGDHLRRVLADGLFPYTAASPELVSRIDDFLAEQERDPRSCASWSSGGTWSSVRYGPGSCPHKERDAMPPAVAEITRNETGERARLLRVNSYDVTLDLTLGEETFQSTSVISFDCRERGAATYADLVAADVVEDQPEREAHRPGRGLVAAAGSR